MHNDNQDPLKQDPLKRYIKGMNSIQPSLLDPIQAAGWKAANGHRNKHEHTGSAGAGTIELLLQYSAGKGWTKWTALLFGICALIYCYMSSYSVVASIFIVAGASFCGYVIIGLSVLCVQIMFYGVFAYLIFQLLRWLV